MKIKYPDLNHTHMVFKELQPLVVAALNFPHLHHRLELS